MRLLDTDKLKDKVPLITSTSLDDPNGLFGELVFGRTVIERRRRFGLIDLHCRVIHPDAFRLLKRLSRSIEDIVLMKESYSFDEETKMFVKDPKGRSGMGFLLEYFDKVQFRLDTPERKRIYEVVKKQPIFMRYLLVLPAGLRPISQEHRQLSSINEQYMSILKLSNSLALSTSPSLTDSLIAEMQKLLNELWDLLSQINKKSGIIRHDLMGKRVDFSARGVVVPDPTLPLGYIGLPLKIVVKIFEPYVVHQLLKKNSNPDEFRELLKNYNLAFTFDGIKSLLKMISSGFIKPDERIYEFVKQHAEAATKDKVVIGKRDPALHRLSLQALFVKIVDGDVIRVSPYHIDAWNMDFDGDQMAVYAPLTEEAQQEAKTKLLANLNSPVNIGVPWPSVKNDVYAGIYILTKES